MAGLEKPEKPPFLEKLDWERLCSAMPDGIILIDRDFNIRFMNEAFSALTGQDSKRATGSKCYDIFACSQCHTPQCLMTRISGGADRLTFDGEKHCKCGELIPCIVHVAALRDDSGELLGIIETVTDAEKLLLVRHELVKSHERLRKAMGGIIQAISLTIEKRDPYTAGHQRRVAKLCRAIAPELSLNWERIQGLRMAAVIHDFGKIHVPAAILNKPGELSEHEIAIIRQHVQTAYDILKNIEFPWPIAEAVYQHHERLDGSGYPRGLKGDQIILEARILAVADVVESISSFRPYRPALGVDAALNELKNGRGRLYDERVVDICLALFIEHGFDFEIKFVKDWSKGV